MKRGFAVGLGLTIAMGATCHANGIDRPSDLQNIDFRSFKDPSDDWQVPFTVKNDGERPNINPSAHPESPTNINIPSKRQAIPGPRAVIHGPAVVNHGSRHRNEIALTFDADMTPAMLKLLQDGVVKSWYNKQVIDILEQNDVPATLFMTGLWAQTYPETAKQLADNPLFEIGNHSFNHNAFTDDCYGLPSIPNNKAAADIESSQQAIKDATGVTPIFFRFPGLCHDSYDTARVTKNGMQTIDGTGSGDAWIHNPQAIADNVLKQAQNGSIIVFHMHGDGELGTGYAPETAAALKKVIPELRKKYKFVTVSKLLAS